MTSILYLSKRTKSRSSPRLTINRTNPLVLNVMGRSRHTGGLS
jgi:hypothetical protein